MLVTATDGNHGRAVARMAAHFGVGRPAQHGRTHPVTPICPTAMVFVAGENQP
jgi:hypothetical protein